MYTVDVIYIGAPQMPVSWRCRLTFIFSFNSDRSGIAKTVFVNRFADPATLSIHNHFLRILRDFNRFEIFIWPYFRQTMWSSFSKFSNDIIAIIPKDAYLDLFNYISSINNSIQFEYEFENINKISFLDLQINRSENGQVKFTIYRKPTHTNRYLDFNTNKPMTLEGCVLKRLTEHSICVCRTI